MSWCRMGSLCSNTYPLYACNMVCGDTCPGSDLHIYEERLREFGDSEDRIVCHAYRLHCGEDYVTTSPETMYDHVEDHVLASHHVRTSIRNVVPIDRTEIDENLGALIARVW